MEDRLRGILFDPMVGRLVTAVIAVILVATVVRLMQRYVSRYVGDGEVRYKARKAIGIVGYLVGFILVLSVFSTRLGQLTVALGVAGAGIAFALQEVIASVAGWLAVSWGGFYRTGDRVQLGGIKGDVIDIGILRTTLMELGQWVDGDLYNGRTVRVANSFVFKEPVFNYSGEFPFLWDEIRIPVKYGSDAALARRILEDVANEVVREHVEGAARHWAELTRQFRIEDASVEPMISLVANDNWLEYTLRYVVDYKRRRGTKDALFSRIVERVEATEGAVALASATFQLVEAPVFDVRLRTPATDEKK